MKCPICKKEIEEGSIYLPLHYKCYDKLDDAIYERDRYRKALYQIRNICCVEGDAAGRMSYEVANIALEGEEE